MKAAPFVARMLKRLQVSERALEQVARAAEEAGHREADAAKRLRAEWLNDTVVVEGADGCRRAARDPDAAFVAWARARLGDPLAVTAMAHDAVRAAHGNDTALLFSEVRWRQEVAWARRMRGSDNDRIAVLAETWLTAARRDMAKLFRGVVELYVDEAAAEPGYRESVYHLMPEEEILDGRADEAHWRPLWLRFAEREFGRSLNRMPRAQIVQLAARLRETERRERTARDRTRQADGIRARRPSLMVAVLSSACDRGLSSDDLVGAEAEFVRGVEDGDVDLSNRSRDAVWRVFADRLEGWAGRTDPPAPDERARRLREIEELPPSWLGTLPGWFAEMGASKRALVDWFDDISAPDGRGVPSDPAVDFGMFLVEGGGRRAR